MAVRWYVLNVYSGFEKKVVESIREMSAKRGCADDFEELLIPTEEVTHIRRGKKVTSERKFFPGYILLKMELSDESWNFVKNTPKVTGFLGAGHKPMPISEAEATRLLKQLEEGAEKPRSLVMFEIGEEVKVCDGPFESFTGLVEEVDSDRERLKVSVSIFGRSTPVELEYSQVSKNLG